MDLLENTLTEMNYGAQPGFILQMSEMLSAAFSHWQSQWNGNKIFQNGMKTNIQQVVTVYAKPVQKSWSSGVLNDCL